MAEVEFKADVFTSELLCDRCENRSECPFTGEDDDLACETYKCVEKNRE